MADYGSVKVILNNLLVKQSAFIWFNFLIIDLSVDIISE